MQAWQADRRRRREIHVSRMATMVRIKNLAGMRFGKLVAVEPTAERKNGYTVWICRCDCGNTALYPSRYLKYGWAASCGCTENPPRYEDLMGRRFGKLVVTGVREERDEQGRVLWDCVCDCGGHVVVPSGQLKHGYRKSCGCLSHTSLQDLTGQSFGNLTVIAYDGKRKGNHFWKCRCACGNEVSIAQNNLKFGHTASCGCMKDYRSGRHFVDGTCIENIRKNTIPKNNKSGVRGVYLDAKRGKWHAQITFKGKTKFLGCFDSIQEAAEARHRGEEVFRNFLAQYDKKLKQGGRTKDTEADVHDTEADVHDIEDAAGA